MKALQGVEGHVEWAEYPAPPCDVGQVRIRVAAAGLNRADLLQRAGHYPPPPGASEILGLECAGVISEVGAGVAAFNVGDRVCTLLAGGGMAEEVVVDARHVLPVPEGLSLIEAAGILEVYGTVWLNLFQLARLQPGEKVLLHAGASGIGSAAIQLCKAFGNPTWVTVGSAERLEYCQALGAQGGVLRGEGLSALKDLGPFDVILDPVGGNYAELNLQVAAQDGRWVLIGVMGGREAKLDMGLMLGKRVQLIGSTLRSRDDTFKAELLRELGQEVLPLFTEKRLNPQIARTFPIGEAEEAFAELATNQITGKVVLVVDPTLV
ncbi:NAD(P)H-quinone oxidoreductase [Pseudomonas japonica]|uniref:NAD(P)H-quinone oxidoreductase n=1 Tax=Pseudomonas japonica TaxID=256466 RepID=UPI0015E2B32A|nr:NAD(P)H-quinone oxidoreductase [Pseudomonas japonica]MBA1242044.1 NAD(P)H-quinone oxidoreductase [Pseudomonas japonica]MBA1291285.1 NAD(P)H-quinone oxidoreductase [Pseudomonas japonica]